MLPSMMSNKLDFFLEGNTQELFRNYVYMHTSYHRHTSFSGRVSLGIAPGIKKKSNDRRRNMTDMQDICMFVYTKATVNIFMYCFVYIHNIK